MHSEILSDRQREMLPFIAQFRRSFYLVGGTAIALHVGHRRSIDFDLFKLSLFKKSQVKQKILQAPYSKSSIFEDVDQLHFYVNDVKITFFTYPYLVEHPVKLDNIISMPTLLSLAAMKAFALGRRAKWKDYVDLYFLIKHFFSVKEISAEAEHIFKEMFSDSLFKKQLAFHKDIDYGEAVEYMPGFSVPNDEVKSFLVEKSLEV